MTSYIKGIYSYVRPGTDTATPITSSPATSTTQSGPTAAQSPEQQPGYLKWAVSGVASGIYNVGSTTVGAGVSSVKWVAGTSYNVGAGVVGTAGTVVGTVAGTAGSLASTVGSGASSVVSKVTTKKKEHSD